jgi:hypothetical protein
VAEAGLEPHDRTLAAMRVVRRLEEPRGVSRLVLAAPRALVALGRPVVPTEISLLRRPPA